MTSNTNNPTINLQSKTQPAMDADMDSPIDRLMKYFNGSYVPLRHPEVWHGLPSPQQAEINEQIIRCHTLAFPDGRTSCTQWIAAQWPKLQILDNDFAAAKVVDELVLRGRRNTALRRSQRQQQWMMDEQQPKLPLTQIGVEWERSRSRDGGQRIQWNVHDRKQSRDRLQLVDKQSEPDIQMSANQLQTQDQEMQSIFGGIPHRRSSSISQASIASEASIFGNVNRIPKWDGLDAERIRLVHAQAKLLSIKHASAGDLLMVYTRRFFNRYSAVLRPSFNARARNAEYFKDVRHSSEFQYSLAILLTTIAEMFEDSRKQMQANITSHHTHLSTNFQPCT